MSTQIRILFPILTTLLATTLLSSCRCSGEPPKSLSSAMPAMPASAQAQSTLPAPVTIRAEPLRETRLELNNLATLVVPPSAFAAMNSVTLKAAQSQDVAETFEQTIGATGPGSMRRAPYEIVVDTGKVVPKKSLSLSLVIPKALQAVGGDGRTRQVEALVEYVSGSQYELHDSFTSIEARPGSDSKTLVIELEPAAFTEINNAAGNYQAVVLLAVPNPEPVPAGTSGAGR